MWDGVGLLGSRYLLPEDRAPRLVAGNARDAARWPIGGQQGDSWPIGDAMAKPVCLFCTRCHMVPPAGQAGDPAWVNTRSTPPFKPPDRRLLSDSLLFPQVSTVSWNTINR